MKPRTGAKTNAPCKAGAVAGNGSINRRDFLRLGAAATAGLASSSIWFPRLIKAQPTDTSRVVVVTDDQVLQGSLINAAVVRIMVDAGLMALKDTSNPDDAWRALLPSLASDITTGLKINTINSLLASHPEVTLAVADSLAAVSLGSSTYPLNQIVIWDRWDWELQAAGYSLNTSTTGVRCFGTDHSGVGYNPALLNVNGTQQHVSRGYTDYSDQLINLCLLKNHTVSGVTHALKNHLGTIDNPEALHPNEGDPYIPALNSALIGAYGSRQKLCLCDALFGIRYGGPMGPPQFYYRGIILAEDPVAMDVICRQILLENGCTTTNMAHYIETASAPPYSLGNSDLIDIERVDVINPSVGITTNGDRGQPAQISLGKNYPEPFNSSTMIPLSLERPSQVRIDILNSQGQQICSLYHGSLTQGQHTFTWEGRTDQRVEAASGKYLVRIKCGGKNFSKTITLLR